VSAGVFVRGQPGQQTTICLRQSKQGPVKTREAASVPLSKPSLNKPSPTGPGACHAAFTALPCFPAALQEKNKLITDIKQLKSHYAKYEPTILELKKKYEVAMKEKMLMSIERDKADARVSGC
jgi:hypothetical protein